MKVYALLFLLCLMSQIGLGQDSTAASPRKAYLMLGSTVPLNSDQSSIFSLVVAGKLTEQLAYSTGAYGRKFTDKKLSEYKLRVEQRPQHELSEMNFSLGKIMHLNSFSFVSFFAGPSLVRYDMPHNFRVTHSGGWKSSSRFEYDTRTYVLPGATARADVTLLPLREVRISKKSTNGIDLGASAGGLVTYNRKLTSWGLNLSLVLGLKEAVKKKDKAD